MYMYPCEGESGESLSVSKGLSGKVLSLTIGIKAISFRAMCYVCVCGGGSSMERYAHFN